ncbi:hypothetical protein COCOBI_10-0240 [Coccomyxa sp. Obi]|nr:hypothetical protein COCOBI_10-0240 [Coccomyxa sp. Obi]
MPELKKKVLQLAYPHLPEELWLRIANFLCTRDWVRASGACKALQQMQVERITLHLRKTSATPPAMLWMASRLQAVGASAQPLPLSTVLSVKMGRPYKVIGEMENSNVGKHLLEILQKAINLSRLNVVCKAVPALPQMTSLKHLSLQVEDAVLSAEQHLGLDNVYPRSLALGSYNTRVTLCGHLSGLQSALECWSDVRAQIKGLRVRIPVDRTDFDKNIYGSELWDNREVLQFIEPTNSPLWNLSSLGPIMSWGPNGAMGSWKYDDGYEFGKPFGFAGVFYNRDGSCICSLHNSMYENALPDGDGTISDGYHSDYDYLGAWGIEE